MQSTLLFLSLLFTLLCFIEMNGYVMTDEHSYSFNKQSDDSIKTIKQEETSDYVATEGRLKKRRIKVENNQSSLAGTTNLTLRLKKQSSDMNTWSILQQEQNNNSIVSTNFPPQLDLIRTIKSEIIESQDENSNPEFQQPRALFNEERLAILQDAFSESHYCTGKRRRRLSDCTGLSEKQIARWFESRRRREKQATGKSIRKKKSIALVTSIQQSENVDICCSMKEEEEEEDGDFVVYFKFENEVYDEEKIPMLAAYQKWEWDPEVFYHLFSACNSTVPSDMSFSKCSNLDFRASRLPGEDLSLRHYLRLTDCRMF